MHYISCPGYGWFLLNLNYLRLSGGGIPQKIRFMRPTGIAKTFRTAANHRTGKNKNKTGRWPAKIGKTLWQTSFLPMRAT
jgi:hypothetical protein